nr:MerR family transcriptional regulator [uncultured Draconibacterium sp.]
MPYKKPKIEKILYSIGEVADMFGVNVSHIRYWENQFEALKPVKNKKGNRQFTKKDIETIRFIHHLVKERGLTIEGARKKLKENPEDTLNNFEVVKRLQDIRQELIAIKQGLGENEN